MKSIVVFSIMTVLGICGMSFIIVNQNAEIARLNAELAKQTPIVGALPVSLDDVRRIEFRDVQLIVNGEPARMLCTELRQGREVPQERGEKSNYLYFLRNAWGPDNVPGNMWVQLSSPAERK